MDKIVLLISCMHQTDHSILDRSNVRSNVVVVNQCDRDCVERFEFQNPSGETKWCIFISTTERGLSRSRNMALRNAPEDSLCVICDDDETFADDIEAKIKAGFSRMPDADVIAFSLLRLDLENGKQYPTTDRPLRFKQILHTSSLQLVLNKKRVTELGVRFDEKMGSGTGNGGGEENKFMLDIRRRGGRMYYAPECIATVNPGESQWFKGYTPKYMQNLGWASRRSMGAIVGFAYINYWVLSHRFLYHEDMKATKAFCNIIRGFFARR